MALVDAADPLGQACLEILCELAVSAPESIAQAGGLQVTRLFFKRDPPIQIEIL